MNCLNLCCEFYVSLISHFSDQHSSRFQNHRETDRRLCSATVRRNRAGSPEQWWRQSLDAPCQWIQVIKAYRKVYFYAYFYLKFIQFNGIFRIFAIMQWNSQTNDICLDVYLICFFSNALRGKGCKITNSATRKGQHIGTTLTAALIALVVVKSSLNWRQEK